MSKKNATGGEPVAGSGLSPWRDAQVHHSTTLATILHAERVSGGVL